MIKLFVVQSRDTWFRVSKTSVHLEALSSDGELYHLLICQATCIGGNRKQEAHKNVSGSDWV
jgi:hypothetical protein